MAVTENAYTGNGSTTNYSFTFPYLKSTDIEVQVDATVQATNTWSLANATTVQFNTAPSNGAKIKILRQTNVDNLTATFYAGSAIKSEDLNDNYTQNLYKTQEVGNRYFANTGGTMTGDLTMGEDANLTFEGATDNAYETTFTVTDPTADRTITLPNVTGTVVTTGDTGTVTATMMAANSVDSSELVDGSIDTSHIADSQVTTAKIAADAVNGTKIADDSIDSEHYVDGSIDTAHIADLQVTTAKIAADAITGAKVADNAIDSEHYAADSIDAEHYAPGSVDATALASNAVTQAKVADDAIGADELASSAVVTASIVDNAVTLAKMADSSVGTSELVDSAVTAVKLATDAVTNAKVADDAITSTELADNAVTTAKIADAELTTLAGMQSGTASILAAGTTLTATLAEINTVVDGKSVETTISDTDAAYPTSGAVIDYVTAQIAPLGGLEVVATEVAFPNTQPASGVVISISDAGGVVFNGSGVSTTGRTVGGSTVTINGAPSSLYSETLVAGVGLMVSSTGSSQTYNYHKILGKEDDIKQLSDDINDFNARYRVNSGEPGSSNDEGDLVYDTAANKMKVYDGSSWGEVTSTGDFKFLVPVDAGTTTAATWDGSDTSFDLKETTNSGSAASITSVYQLMISVNGVIQKPNTGSWSGSGEGFYLTDSDTIRFATAPATGSSVFVVQFGSALTPTTPADNTVSTAKIQNLAVTTAKIAADAIDGTKIADDAVGAEHIEVLDAPLQFGDGIKAQFGASNDLEITHDGSNSTISEAGAGQLLIRGWAPQIQVNYDPSIGNTTGETSIRAVTDGAAELYYNAVKKFETTSAGATVTGSLLTTGLASVDYTVIQTTGNYSALNLETLSSGTAGADLATGIDFSVAGTNSARMFATKGGTWGILTNDLGSYAIKAVSDGQVELYYDNSKKAATHASGFKIWSGNLLLDSDNAKAVFGAGDDLEIYHDGTNSTIKNNTGHLYIHNDDTSSGIALLSDEYWINNEANDENMIHAVHDGAVELYYDNSKKFDTTSTGTRITGHQQIHKGGGGGSVPTSLTKANTYLHLGGNEYGTSNNGFFGIGFGFTSTGNTNCRAYVAFRETSHTGYTEGDLVFEIVDGTSDTGATEHFRIAHDGTLTATDTSIASNSDQRLKTNINDFTYDLAKFKQFKPKTFDWRNPGEHGNKTGQRGFLAQDIESIDNYLVGECLIDEDDSDRSLVDSNGKAKTSKLGKNDAMYISVINQLITKIETLETKVAALEAN